MVRSVVFIVFGALVFCGMFSFLFWNRQQSRAEQIATVQPQYQALAAARVQLLQLYIQLHTWDELNTRSDDVQRQKDINTEAFAKIIDSLQQEQERIPHDKLKAQQQEFIDDVRTWLQSNQEEKREKYSDIRLACEKLLEIYENSFKDLETRKLL